MHVIFLGILFGLLTGVSWGIFPIFAKKTKQTPDHWLFGSCLGMGISAIICLSFISLFFSSALTDLDYLCFILEFISGGAWAVTMMAQFSLIHTIGAAKGLSMANGGKTIFATIFAVFFLGSWLFNAQKIFGFLMVIIICIGVYLINKKDKKNHIEIQKQVWYAKNKQWVYLLILSITAIAFSQFPALLDNLKEQASGYQVPIVAPIVKFIPQAIGACSIGCLIIYIRAKIKKDLSVFKIKATYLNIFNGFIYAIGMIFYLYSVFLLNKNTNQQFVNGDGIDAGAGATAFALTNFANIISAIGGIFFLHEKFNKREIIYFIIGGIVLTIGAILITFVDQFTFLQVWGQTKPLI